MYGDGSQTRDFTFVEDVIEANRTLLTSDAATGKWWTSGAATTSTSTRWREIHDQIDPSFSIEYDDRQAGDAEHIHADVSTVRELLDYEPTYTIRAGVAEFVEGYRENRNWYEPLVR